MAAAIDFFETTELSEQPLLAGLTDEELTELAALATIRSYQPGEKIIATGDPATSLFFLGAAWSMSPCPTASGWRR